jgi:prepilin peptidase CpaA
MPVLLKAILLAMVIFAGISDLRSRRIPNWLSLSGVLIGITINAALLPHGWITAVFGMGCALLVYLPLYLVRGMGAGDVKLMAAVGAIAGPSNWFTIFLATALIAGAASLLVVIMRKQLHETLRNISIILSALLHWQSPLSRKQQLKIDNPNALRMPHGAFIASGAMVFLLLSRLAWQ